MPTPAGPEPKLSPIEIPDQELAAWSDRRPLTMRLALAWAKYSPRGKGAVPRWFGRTFGKRWRTTVRTGEGARLAVYPPQLDVFTHIARTGGWSPDIADACTKLLRPGDVLYDIGANVGYISVTVGGRRPDVKIYAFEPQPYLARGAAVSARMNHLSNIAFYATLLGSTDGSADLYVPAHGVHASLHAMHDGTSVACPIWRLDTIIDHGWVPPPDLVKIDVEGAEDQVFAGAPRLLGTRPPAILMEAYPGNQTKLKSLLLKLGAFAFYGMTPNGFRPVPAEGEDESLTDLLAVPPGRALKLD